MIFGRGESRFKACLLDRVDNGPGAVTLRGRVNSPLGNLCRSVPAHPVRSWSTVIVGIGVQSRGICRVGREVVLEGAVIHRSCGREVALLDHPAIRGILRYKSIRTPAKESVRSPPVLSHQLDIALGGRHEFIGGYKSLEKGDGVSGVVQLQDQT